MTTALTGTRSSVAEPSTHPYGDTPTNTAPRQRQRRPRAFPFDVAIVGLGYVGLPTALAYQHAGLRVLALDVSIARISAIIGQTVDLVDSDRVRLADAVGNATFTLSSDASLLAEAESVVVCVPTPVDDHLVPDLTMLRAACAMVTARARSGQLLMLTSTSYVGCTDDLLVAPLVAAGFVMGEDISVAFSPERIDPGNTTVSHEDVPRVVGAVTPRCLERAMHLLSTYTSAVHGVSSVRTAEMTKLAENTFRAVNIALANEFADICRALEISITEVIDAASTKPYGFMPFRPGPGVGGHCIPCDPHYLLWQLTSHRLEAPMIRQAMIEIAARPARVVDRILAVLSAAGRGVAGARVLVMGVAYKPNIADHRESPAIEILDALASLGAHVAYVDGYIPQLKLPSGTVMRSIADAAGFAADVILLHTRHASLDLGWIDSAAVVIDATYRETSLPARVVL